MKKGKAMKEAAILLGFFLMFAWGMAYAQQPAQKPIPVEQQLLQEQIVRIQTQLQLMQYQAKDLQEALRLKRQELKVMMQKAREPQKPDDKEK